MPFVRGLGELLFVEGAVGGFVEEEGVVGVSADGGDGDAANGGIWRWF